MHQREQLRVRDFYWWDRQAVGLAMAASISADPG